MRKLGKFSSARDNGIIPVGESLFKILDLTVGGAFARSTEASYLVRAPTDGSTPFLAWAPAGQRRIEDRGDGYGPMFLHEGTRTNFILQSRNITVVPPWSNTTFGTVSRTGAFGPSPDGYQSASVVDVSASSWCYPQNTSLIIKQRVLSVYVRASSSVNHWQGNTNGGIRMSGNTTTTWERRQYFASASFAQVFNADASAVDTTPISAMLDLWQLEDGFFPSSPIQSVNGVAASGSRGTDGITYAFGAYPRSFLTKGFSFDWVPDASSDDMISGSYQHALFSFGANTSYMLFQPETGIVKLRIANAGAAKFVQTITFSRYQKMTVTVQPNEGRLVIEGATTGNGIFAATGGPWTWDSGQLLRPGDIAASAYFGRLGTFRGL